MRLHLRVAVAILLVVLSAGAASAQRSDDTSERSFVASVAATVYGLAWPSATYEDWSVRSVAPRPNGLDIVARLTGESTFGGKLWLDLVFEFRNGGFSDLGIAGHSPSLFPPFATTTTIGALAMELASTVANSSPGGATAVRRAPAAQSGLAGQFWTTLTSAGGVVNAKRMFDAVTQKYPTAVLFLEQEMNQFGYELLNAGNHRDAIVVFQMNRDAYPNSANTYDSLSDAQLAAGDRVNALRNAEKAIEMLATDRIASAELRTAIRESAVKKVAELRR